jgi:hypothetical protein
MLALHPILPADLVMAKNDADGDVRTGFATYKVDLFGAPNAAVHTKGSRLRDMMMRWLKETMHRHATQSDSITSLLPFEDCLSDVFRVANDQVNAQRVRELRIREAVRQRSFGYFQKEQWVCLPDSDAQQIHRAVSECKQECEYASALVHKREKGVSGGGSSLRGPIQFSVDLLTMVQTNLSTGKSFQLHCQELLEAVSLSMPWLCLSPRPHS